ncbi:class I SAM-dependent methyltransferase [Nocardioides currus]|uniref:SAM-dependent methyltransferase n=1 Tax=Nocardioides currus TaxID=2133958 RepID=A0A2R7Z313_9ACTN|nr:class I SAM-dependent methyltransferase [Nocardioides currus]PUA83025.1 SAM-dependent methyltransferase [Nocardioides currus]
MGELEEIKARYARREPTGSIYGLHHNDAFLALHQRDAIMRNLVVGVHPGGFEGLRVLEVGCGSGMNLVRFLMWGVAPANLVGVDLLPERCEAARVNLPAAATILEGDAAEIDFEQPFDVVLQSTTLSSILDPDLRRRVAETMWQLTAPGGAVLSYDFAVNNPKNPDVRKVTVPELRELFPEGEMTARRVTLAPPVGRRVGRWPLAYKALSKVPPLLSHRLVLFRKD